ncbi:MAG: hypothetical protein FWD78_12500 [Treponema sp.]|nr:hypothetical protein [Treponema sp.]
MIKRKKLLNIVITVLVLVLVSSAVYAGGSNQNTGTPAAAAASGPFRIKDQNLTEPGTLPVVKNQITLTLGMPVNIQVSDYYDNDLTRYLEKMTGVKLSFILYDAGTDGETKLGLQVAAGDKLPDLMLQLGIADQAKREAYGQAGAIIPLNDYIKNLGFYTNKAVAQTSAAKSGVDPWLYGTADDGTIWGYMSYNTDYSNSFAARAWYNDDFAKKLGMSSDDWTGGGGKGKIPTQDWFYKYLIGVRDNDVNGNGDKNDEIPITGATGWRQQVLKWITNQYFYNDYASTDKYWFVKNGQLYYNYDTPEYRDALRFLYKLYNERLFDESAITQNAVTLAATVNANPHKVGIAVSGGIGIYDADARAVYKPIPIVQGPSGFATTTYFEQVPIFPWAISSNSQYPEAAFRFLDAMASDPDLYLFTNNGLKGRDWRVALPGEIGLYGDQSGIEPYLVTLIQTWGNVVTNAQWKAEFGIDYLNRKSSNAWNGDPLLPAYLHGQAIIQMVPFKPAEYPVDLIFTSAETQQWAETRTNIRNYVEQTLAQFSTGQLDIEKDWDTYVRNLKTLGSDQLLAVDRAAYARMNQISGK